ITRTRSLIHGLIFFAATLLQTSTQALAANSPFPQGKAGFIVSDIGYVLSRDATQTGACPRGRSISYREVYQRSPEGARHDGESDQDYTQRIQQGAQEISTLNGQSMCMIPQSAPADIFFRTVTGPNVPVDGGLDLDGQDSHATGR